MIPADEESLEDLELLDVSETSGTERPHDEDSSAPHAKKRE